jgi:hypothetical protein
MLQCSSLLLHRRRVLGLDLQIFFGSLVTEKENSLGLVSLVWVVVGVDRWPWG